MDKIGIVFNHTKPLGEFVAQKLVSWLEKNEVDIVPLHFQEQEFEFFLEYEADKISACEVILVLGGDGTLLHAARNLSKYDIPLLGVNLGNLGFLTEVEMDSLYHYMEKLLSGKYRIGERMMLDCVLYRSHKKIKQFHAFNDVVIAKDTNSRIITCDTYISKEYFTTYQGDGVIVSSPTGSTGYSLSAGGPIVLPEMDLMLLTPVCPHALYSRPLVIAPEETIWVKLIKTPVKAMLSLDGQDSFPLKNEDLVVIKRSTRTVKMVALREKSFFKVLNEKLKESGGGHR